MPWFSYHGGHSGEFCRHAAGSLQAVVERAIDAGFSHYGISEHVPRDRREDLFPEERDLTPEDLARTFERYVGHARALQARYADRIELLVGLETERLPPGSWPSRMRQLRELARADYVIGSVHDVDGCVIDMKPELTAAAAERAGGREALQVRYFDALAELVRTLRPEVVGHVDLIRKFDGPAPSFGPRAWQRLEHTLEAAREVGAVLDVNAATHRRGLGPVYPLPEILRRARQMGIGVTLGDDSHGVHDVGVGLDACMRAIADAGYREVCYFQRRDGHTVRARADIAEVSPASR